MRCGRHQCLLRLGPEKFVHLGISQPAKRGVANPTQKSYLKQVGRRRTNMQPSAQPKMSDATQIKPQQILPPFASHPSFIWWLAGLELQHAVQFVERSKNLPGTVARLSAEVSSDFGFYTPNMGRPELLIPPPIHWLAQVNWTGAALF